MTRICFDDIIFSLQRFGGASTYWSELTKRIGASLPGGVEHISGSRLGRLHRPKCQSRVFHSSHFRVSPQRGVVNIGTIHDLTYEKGLVGGLGSHLNLFERKRCIKNSDAIICVSESTRQDLVEHYGKYLNDKPVVVIHHGPSLIGHLAVPRAANPAKGPSHGWDGYFLYVGGRASYKNFPLALLALRDLNAISKLRFGLVCTGSPFSEQEQQSMDALGLGGLVKCCHLIDQNEMLALYQGALGLLYPSRYEGFGLPVLDAMSVGCPVVASNTSSIPEISGGAALLCAPDDLEAYCQSMQKLLDSSFRGKCIMEGNRVASQFSWDRSAAQHMEIYSQYL